MSTAATSQVTPQEKPINRAWASVHQLLRRGMRIVAPASPEEVADRTKALARLDEDASAYYGWKEIEDQAKREAATLKPVILAAVEKLGSVPDSAPKSLRADTEGFVCTRTIGSTMEIDDEAVLEFDLAMNTKKLREIFDALFVRRIEYQLSPAAQQMMQHGKLPQQYAEMIHSYYSRCFSAKTTTPTLNVDSKEAIEQKRLAAIAAAEEKASKKKGTKVNLDPLAERPGLDFSKGERGRKPGA